MAPSARGTIRYMPHRTFVWLCLLPLAVVTVAFFLLPMARLVVTGAEGPQGLAGYLAILTEPRYRATLVDTVLLATAPAVCSARSWSLPIRSTGCSWAISISRSRASF